MSTPSAATNLDAFINRLRGYADGGRIANAQAMLRAERFQLFSQVEEGALVGVVRSQSSVSRVYACRLDAQGTFSCGTQNLRACGGLGGAVCKHLLVLVIGLARSGAVVPEAVEAWVRASRKRRPTLDKDVLS